MTFAFLTCSPQTHERFKRLRRQLWTAIFLCFALQVAEAIHAEGKADAEPHAFIQTHQYQGFSK